MAANRWSFTAAATAHWPATDLAVISPANFSANSSNNSHN
ncbi:hypothetical protein SAMN04487965_1215 [Microbulbifer donghaiensis]|uniref:Uncharacterized protein n=1 Tax=Microbulbifer donghaiensis TaxID=494016 RepID=A0A1M4YCQ1_9GAMM|nr:hypothetical protein SAMN04487965_1215 [Microbulbifer donghaiensis]